MKFYIAAVCCLFTTSVMAQPIGVQQLKEQAIRSAIQEVENRVVQLRFLTSQDSADLGASLSQGLRSSAYLLDDGVTLLTSDLYLERDPAAIIVSTSDRSELLAEVVARDYARRLVLIRLKEAQLQVLPIQNCGTCRPGETAISLGRGYQPERLNLSVGIISATNRLFGNAIQTDAAISAVNYGGPLITLQGELIGIISPIAPVGQRGEDWYDSGIGFAVPMNLINSRIDRLQAGEDIHAGWMGLRLEQANPYTSPPIIKEVRGPAWKAKLKPGDKILRINNRPTNNIMDFRWELRTKDAGEVVLLEIDRGDQKQEVLVRLEKRPAEPKVNTDKPKIDIQPILPIPKLD